MKPKHKRKNDGITLIKKANNLIESRFKFDIWEMRFFLSVIAQIHRDDDAFSTYRVYYSDIVKTFGIKSHRSYDMLREAAKTLLQKKFYITFIENGFERETAYHIIRTVSYLKEGQSGEGIEQQEYIDVTVEDQMKPLLLQLQKSFTAYDLSNVVNLGVNSVRIYELLKQYESIGSRLLQFKELKRMLELENEYPEFSNFYRRIIEPSIKEINEFTDIQIREVEKLKEGKRFVALKFRFHKNKVADPTLLLPHSTEKNEKNEKNERVEKVENEAKTNEKPDILDAGNDDRFKNFYPKIVETLGVTPSVFFDLLKQFSDSQLEQAIRVTNRAKTEGQIKSSISGFFIQALKNGYIDQKESMLRKKNQEAQNALIAQQLIVLENEKSSKVFDKVRELTANDPDITIDAIKQVKENPVNHAMLRHLERQKRTELTLEDFRQDKNLRWLVIDAIVNAHFDKFADIITEFNNQVNDLKARQVF